MAYYETHPIVDGEVLDSKVVTDDGDGKRDASSARRDGDSGNKDGNKGGGKGGGKGGVGRNLLNAVVPATALASRKTWDVSKRAATAVSNKLRDPKFLVKRVLPGGMVLAGIEIFDAIRSADPIIHNPPAEGRTRYLPVAGNGDIDSPHGDPNATVEALDAQIDKVNAETWGFDPDKIWSYCDAGNCGEGCIEIEVGPLEFDEEGAVTPMLRWSDIVDEIYGTLSQYAGEMWADRLLQKYGSNGIAELESLVTRTEDVATALVAAVKASEEMGVGSYQALRHMIRAGREEMQGRLDDENSTYGWVGDALFGGRGEGSLERLKEAGKKVSAAQQSNDEAIAKLNEALDAWDAKIAGTEDNTTSTPPVPFEQSNNADSSRNDDGEPMTPLPGSPGGVGSVDGGPTADPLDNDEKTDPFMDSLADKLGNLGGGSESPFGSSPLGASGGGMPDMGSGAPLSGGATNPFESADSPLSDNAENPFEDDEDEVLDEGEGGIEEESDDDTLDEGEGGFEDEDLDDIVEKTDDAADGSGEDAPAEGEDAPVTAEASVAPAAAVNTDPNSPEARTVTLPDGRQIEFSDSKTAEMVRALVAADPSAPTSIYTAADQAGFPVPPMGQPIGDMVPPSSIRPGDLVMGAAGNGVFIGNGEVLMENQEVKPLAEVTQFTEPNQGVYRLDNPDAPAGTDPSMAAAQPVSADGTAAPVTGDTSPVSGGSQPDGMSTTTGTPGQPDTVPAGETVTPDADQGAGLGDTTEEESLDPNAAAF